MMANYLASTPFVQQVVFDSINELGFTWHDAYCMLVVYIEAMEDSKGALNLGNVYAYGAQDSRITAAKVRKQEFFPNGPRQIPNDQMIKIRVGSKKKWNGKDSSTCGSPCRYVGSSPRLIRLTYSRARPWSAALLRRSNGSQRVALMVALTFPVLYLACLHS